MVLSQAIQKHVFWPQSQGDNILDFQAPAPPDEISIPDPCPSQRTQGWNTSAREIFAVDLAGMAWNIQSEKVSGPETIARITFGPNQFFGAHLRGGAVAGLAGEY